MKVVILCGGKGTRLAEETKLIPKPMVKIGNKPILIHIMNIYQKYGFNEFVLAIGYRGFVIENYLKKNKKFKVKIFKTGLNNLTGKRLFKLRNYLKNERFMLTYGDGVTSQNLKSLLNFHVKNKKIATLTAVRPPTRFGELSLNNKSTVNKFEEKPHINQGWINGGFFVFEPQIFNFLSNKNTMLEREPINKLVKKKQLAAYQHRGFWHCMDTMRDKILLNKIWEKKKKW